MQGAAKEIQEAADEGGGNEYTDRGKGEDRCPFLPEAAGIDMDGAGKQQEAEHDLYQDSIEVDAADKAGGFLEDAGLDEADAKDRHGGDQGNEHDADDVRQT